MNLRRRLENAGLTRQQAEKVLRTYSRQRIERQLLWLPYRNAKNPPGYLLAALQDDYAEPLAHQYHQYKNLAAAAARPAAPSAAPLDSRGTSGNDPGDE